MPTLSHFTHLQTHLPWIQSPLIVNGPMAGFAGPALATAITQAGGHGQLGSLNDAVTLEKQLSEVRDSFVDDPYYKSTGRVPVGVGFLLFLGKMEGVVEVVKKYRPAVVWLFAAKALDDYVVWAEALRAASPGSKVWVQVGSVAAALHVAASVGPDALVIQGADAGGHGYEKGAGIISLLPEAVDALAVEFGHIPILASGGIVDGRAVAAALSLGACGVVMGTRFLSADETAVHPLSRRKILDTSDGGQTTVRAKLFDELKGPNAWPVEYDGRGLITESYRDHTSGISIEELRKMYSEAVKQDHAGFGEGKDGRAVIWAGTGVGLVKRQQSAKEIVKEVREGARKALSTAMTKL